MNAMDGQGRDAAKWLYRVAAGGLLLTAVSVGAEPQSVRWSFGPPMPMAKSSRATIGVGESIVTVGGTWWKSTSSGQKFKRWTPSVYLLDTRKMEWRSLPTYPLAVGYAFAAAIGKEVYVIGGRGESRSYNETFVLDLASPNPKWRAGPSLPSPRWGPVGGVIRDVIYIAGGNDGSPPHLDGEKLASDVLAFDPKDPDRGWQRVAALPRPKTEWQMSAVSGDRIYLFGGLVAAPNEADKGLLPQPEAFALHVSSGRWRSLRSLPTPMGSGAAVAVDSRSIILGGGIALALPGSATPDRKARTYFTGECLLYDTVRDDYTPLEPMKMPVTDQGFVYLNRRLFVIGGEDAPYQTRTDALQIGELLED